MSALGELWQWLQGRITRTETGSASNERGHVAPSRQQSGDLNQGSGPTVPGSQQQAADNDARIQRNHRYRAGPWQMK